MECCSQPLIGTNADVSARPKLTRSSDPFNTFIIDTGHQRFCHDPYSQSWFLKMNVDVFSDETLQICCWTRLFASSLKSLLPLLRFGMADVQRRNFLLMILNIVLGYLAPLVTLLPICFNLGHSVPTIP